MYIYVCLSVLRLKGRVEQKEGSVYYSETLIDAQEKESGRCVRLQPPKHQRHQGVGCCGFDQPRNLGKVHVADTAP
jgi:hypothetical protein